MKWALEWIVSQSRTNKPYRFLLIQKKYRIFAEEMFLKIFSTGNQKSSQRILNYDYFYMVLRMLYTVKPDFSILDNVEDVGDNLIQKRKSFHSLGDKLV